MAYGVGRRASPQRSWTDSDDRLVRRFATPRFHAQFGLRGLAYASGRTLGYRAPVVRSRAASPRPGRGRRRGGDRGSRGRPRRARARRRSCSGNARTSIRFAATAQTRSLRRTPSARYGGCTEASIASASDDSDPSGTSSSTSSVPSGSAVKWTSSPGRSASRARDRVPLPRPVDAVKRDLPERRRLSERVRRRAEEAVGQAVEQADHARGRFALGLELGLCPDVEPGLLRELLVERPVPAKEAH